MMVSVDGFFEGENHDISWHNVDEEFGKFAEKQTSEASTLVFGRRTYELMESYWPTEEARTDDSQVAEIMNTLPKIVFSKSLESVNETEYWKNVTLKHEVSAEELRKLKENSEGPARHASAGVAGGDIAVLGSSDLCVSLLKAGVLDELRLMVNPVVLGKGTTLFEGLDKKVNLRLTNTRNFKNGNILLFYDVEK